MSDYSYVRDLASKMSAAFVGRTRTNADVEAFRTLRDDHPQWMTDVCRAGHDHGNILPDDHRYQFIEECVDSLVAADDADEARINLEPSVHTGDLTRWLASRPNRFGWMDEASKELGPFENFEDHIRTAQRLEMEETFDQVLAALREIESDGSAEGDE